MGFGMLCALGSQMPAGVGFTLLGGTCETRQAQRLEVCEESSAHACKGQTLTVTLGSRGHTAQHQTQERHTDKWTPLWELDLTQIPKCQMPYWNFSRIIFSLLQSTVFSSEDRENLGIFTGWLNKILRPEHGSFCLISDVRSNFFNS